MVEDTWKIAQEREQKIDEMFVMAKLFIVVFVVTLLIINSGV